MLLRARKESISTKIHYREIQRRIFTASVPATAVDIITARQAVVVAFADRETRLIEATAVLLSIVEHHSLVVQNASGTNTHNTHHRYPSNLSSACPIHGTRHTYQQRWLTVTLRDRETGFVKTTALVATTTTTHMHSQNTMSDMRGEVMSMPRHKSQYIHVTSVYLRMRRCPHPMYN